MGKLLLSFTALILLLLSIYFGYQVKLESAGPITTGEVVITNGARLEWKPCWFESDMHVDCARLHTSPFNDKSYFSLPVIVFRYHGLRKEADPLVFMAGGPGSGLELGESQVKSYWEPWVKGSGLKRDVVLFDQRGTGLSEPRLRCPDFYDSIRYQLSNNIKSKDSANRSQIALKACYDRLERQGMDFNQISTIHSANDVVDLMNALGYSHWNIKGESYSTRLALVLDQISEGRVRSMVLDSVYPLQKHFFKEWPSLLNDGLQRVFNFCMRHDPCTEEYGDLEAKFWGVVEDLRKEPFEVSLDKKEFGIESVFINDETFVAMLFDAEYETGILYDLPRFIDSFSHNDFGTIHPYLIDYLRSRLDDSISEMVFWSVECKDNPPLDTTEVSLIYNEFPKIQPYLIEEYDNCAIWRNTQNVKGLDEYIKTSTTPVMILAGQDDPVTPVDWADDVLAQYTNAEMFRFPNVSHVVMQNKPCGESLFLQFVNNPQVRPTADCRANMSFDDSIDAFEEETRDKSGSSEGVEMLEPDLDTDVELKNS
ncbi:MAG: Unknown protein [uncultured Thiotrichaceae bacterium]|uniref:AB hydrolase-1 domain-containing protein n=1 Tax=uncultured Thiotrichaceae bacterium TaxID=298394 RepID=A0A6S6SUD4_9GAMM|nr:MAG: Unknown protein [uncultured Thiotrichaceae bacterium]